MLAPSSKNIVQELYQYCASDSDPVALHEPYINGNEWKYVKDCLDTGWLSSVGKYVSCFENAIEDYTGAKHAIAVTNGTAALEMCLRLLDIQPQSEVLIPTLSFVATANAVDYCYAIPHFVDVDTNSFGVSPDKLSEYLGKIAKLENGQCINRLTGNTIHSLIAVHIFGHPADLDPLLDICEKYHIHLIEDAAESLGSFYKNRHTGNFGKVAALSFNGNKIVTSGGGGAILTNDDNIAKLAHHLTTTAKVQHAWEYYHDQVGFNYRLPNINAAIGLAQMEQLPDFLEKKRKIAQYYLEIFSKYEGITVLQEPQYATSNYWLNALILDDSNLHLVDEILKLSHSSNIFTRPAWQLLHTLPMFRNNQKMNLYNAELIVNRLICIPSSVKIAK